MTYDPTQMQPDGNMYPGNLVQINTVQSQVQQQLMQSAVIQQPQQITLINGQQYIQPVQQYATTYTLQPTVYNPMQVQQQVCYVHILFDWWIFTKERQQ